MPFYDVLPSVDPICHRCGESTVMDLNGVSRCRACRRRDHREVLALFSVEAALAQRIAEIPDQRPGATS